MPRLIDVMVLINEPIIIVESDGKTMVEGNQSDYAYRTVCNIRPAIICGNLYVIISLADDGDPCIGEY